jgi:TetR/AcrR family transcriptional repressor of nem operon
MRDKGERRGERTRRVIVERAAALFNTKGYFGASMNDLVRETGLEKGGIYNHFSSKDELACAAFDYSASLMRERFEAALASREGTVERLFAIVDVLGCLADDPPVAGGCPVLNTAVESDGVVPDTDPRKTAGVVVATLEGAVMLSRLYDDPAYMSAVVEHLKEHLKSLETGRSGA